MKTIAILSASAMFLIQSAGLTGAQLHAQSAGDGPPVPVSKNLDSDVSTLAQADNDTTSPDQASEPWLGKSLSFAWSAMKEGAGTVEEKFTAFICDTEALAWNTTSELGRSKGSARYTVQQVTPDVIQISWKDDPQESNLGWIWTLDTTSGKAYGVVVNSQPYENLSIMGEFAILPVPTEEQQTNFACP
ncbi:hypothetical protein GCM10007094_22610 [Pseudovibrio japonicus]|uniref:Uncharacterized protein n=1 Tax=Pseudovibrio japonicus TaxID=366534 RepID=A0ABQ3EGB8_9HYPH|nr:hypothetical protein [Pseudovibrio japonicus]GHB33091.1 hypothetical protein GCM10007094_22610 [Pseudovibrio japonicus]